MTALPPTVEPGESLPMIAEIRWALPVRVLADHHAGLIVLELTVWPPARLILAPEVALELSLHLVSLVSTT
jgi:hypothetical protein